MKYIKPELKVNEIESKDLILTPSDVVLKEDNIIDDDPSYGWGSLF